MSSNGIVLDFDPPRLVWSNGEPIAINYFTKTKVTEDNVRNWKPVPMPDFFCRECFDTGRQLFTDSGTIDDHLYMNCPCIKLRESMELAEDPDVHDTLMANMLEVF